MAHQAIYRKWRPMVFDDVVGQNHITKTLKNQIISDTVGHAYLFCGTRGTGKTTCAKILSRAVNCLNPKDGNPCNECEICRGILDGSIMDVVEIDAASNTGVDDMRGILGDANYAASYGKYSVYIIDEVHMLSTSAFNALLKTLEEPPENVIFILATTEAHKVPQTILSRCQRFDFRRIKVDDIIVRMKEIAYADGYSITDGAYRMLASLADGSLRDGLSIMERVIAASGDSISEDDIINALGISTLDSVFALTDAIINGDAPAVIEIIDKSLAEGKDLGQLSNSMLEHMRALMICKLSDKPEKLLEYDPQTLLKIKSQSQKLTFDKMNHASSLIASAQSDARMAKSTRIIYELAYIKLTRPEIDITPEGIMDRLSDVERKLSSGALPVSPVQQGQSGATDKELLSRITALENAVKNGIKTEIKPEKPKVKEEKKKVSARLFNPIPENELNYDYPTAKIARNWSNTIATMREKQMAYCTPLTNCVIAFDADGIIVLVPDNRYSFTQKTAVNHIDEINRVFHEVTGTNYVIKIAKKSELDESLILNPFDLPRVEKSVVAEKQEVPEQTEEPVEVYEEDKFTKFVERFADIIIDADKEFPKDTEINSGEQTVIKMDQEEDDDSEEFLDDSEIEYMNSDNDDNM